MQFNRQLKIFTPLILLVLMAIGGCGTEPSKVRPNLLFILADDLSQRDLGCFGSPNAITPNIDRLAAEGMCFEACFSAVAMCAPLRMQLYTGLHPVRSGAWPNHSKVYPEVKSIVHYLEPQGYRVGISGKTHIRPLENFPFERLNPELNKKGYSDYMKAGEEPFVLFICSHEPHLPWDKGDSSHFNPQKLKLYDDQLDTPEFRQALCRYYAEIEYLDKQVGEAMQALMESGKEENTIVMFATEQGAQMPGAKWTLYDLGIKAGLIVKWPGVVEPDTRNSALINYIDILPTYLEIIGVPREHLDGKSFLDILQGKSDRHDKYVYGIHTQKGAIGSPESGYPVRSIRNEKFALIKNLRSDQTFSNALTARDGERYWQSWLMLAEMDSNADKLVKRYLHRPALELYDVINDPFQLKNLAGNPTYNDMIRDMEKELDLWMEKQGDRGLETEDMAYTRNHKYN